MVEENKAKRANRYYLDGYVCGDMKHIQVKEKEYGIQRYQGDHSNEFLLYELKNGEMNGRCELYKNGMLCLSWTIEDGKRVGQVCEYSRGRAICKERWDSLLGEDDRRLIENSEEGLVLVVVDNTSNTVIYRGEYDEDLKRNGKGLAYDNESGDLLYEGYWEKDKLSRIAKEFKGDEMIEYDEYDLGDAMKRIPVYTGGFSMIDGEIKRNGKGYLMDRNSGTVIRESEWLNGIEVRGIDLYYGWYVKGMKESIRFLLNNVSPELVTDITSKDVVVKVTEGSHLHDLSSVATELVFSSDSCNDIDSLDLSMFKRLKVLEIQNDCLMNVNSFRITGLNELKSIKIGTNSLTKKKNDHGDDQTRSFHVLNCSELESIEIGQYSFSDFAGGFELNDLPSLKSLKIGDPGYESCNFYACSFGIRDLPNLETITLGAHTFCVSLSTVISNLPHLRSINLGLNALQGKTQDNGCSLAMQNLPNLQSIISRGGSFSNPFSVVLTDIPNVTEVSLNDAFTNCDNPTTNDNISSHLRELYEDDDEDDEDDDNDDNNDSNGFDDGFNNGYSNRISRQLDEMIRNGLNNNYNNGFDAGFDDGFDDDDDYDDDDYDDYDDYDSDSDDDYNDRRGYGGRRYGQYYGRNNYYRGRGGYNNWNRGRNNYYNGGRSRQYYGRNRRY